MTIKTLTAGVLAATLSFTSLTPTTAVADDTRGNAVVGIAALLLLGAAIHNRNDDDNHRSARTPSRTAPRNDAWRVLPANCLTHATRRNGDHVRVFGQRCLNNNYHAVGRLPQGCHIGFRSRSGHNRAGYSANCLRNQGFRTSRH